MGKVNFLLKGRQNIKHSEITYSHFSALQDFEREDEERSCGCFRISQARILEWDAISFSRASS